MFSDHPEASYAVNVCDDDTVFSLHHGHATNTTALSACAINSNGMPFFIPKLNILIYLTLDLVYIHCCLKRTCKTMWPATRVQRAALSVHLLKSGHDPIYLVNLLSRSLTVSNRNGFAYIDKSPIAFESSFLDTVSETPVLIDASDLVVLALHLLWHGLSGRAPIIASFVQTRRSEEPFNLFWNSLYSHVAWLLTPPEIIVSAMQIGRPDLQFRVQRYYMRWLAITYSPQEIISALEILLCKPMHFQTWTSVWDTAEKFLNYNSTQLAAIGTPALFPAECVVVPKATRYTLVLNKSGSLAISERDVVLLVLQLLFDEEEGFATNGLVPESAPEQFHTLLETHPYLFDKSEKAPKVTFCELKLFDNLI